MNHEQRLLQKRLLDIHDQLERVTETRMDHTTQQVAALVNAACDALNTAIADTIIWGTPCSLKTHSPRPAAD